MTSKKAPALLALLLASCASGRSYPGYGDFAPAARLTPRRAATGPDVDALAGRFYGGSIDPAEARAEVDALLERHPGNATLHEMAAHLAELRADHGAAWRHWLAAAADLSSPLTPLYLDRALAYDLTTRQHAATLALLRRLAAEHPAPDVRVDVTRRLIRLLEIRARYDEADRLARDLGFIHDFQMIGAFDNDQGRGFHAEHPPERDPDLSAEHRGLLLPVRWRPARLFDRTGRVRLGDQVSPDDWAVAYLVTHVHSDTAREVQLRVTTPTAVRAWLNGRRVVDQDRVTRDATDNVVVPVSLEAGWNRLLIKSAQDDSGAWTLGARFTDREGAAVPSLRTDAAAHDTPTAPAGELPPNLSPIHEALEAVEPPLRRRLLRHHDSVRTGFERDALTEARRMLEAAPDHPVVLYHAALTHWSNDELGRAMDLLNRGASAFDDRAGFFLQRGAFYRERDRYDRAIEDLERALELEPNARLATMELAGTYEDRRWREHQCRTLEGAVERWPDSGWAIRALGYCLQVRGYLDEAQAAYERAHAQEPGHAWNLERLATLARWQQDHDLALRFAAALRAHRPWDVDAIATAADLHRYAGRREEARALYREAIERDPAWSRPHRRLGTMAYEDGDEAEALTHWAAALDRNPDAGALADRVDALRGDEDDPDRRLMPGDDAIEAAIARAPDMTIDPGAHTVLVLDDEVTTVQQDGSSMRRITQVHLAVTTDGRDDLIRNRVPSNARILQAYSVGPDGGHQEASSIRGGVIRFRGLEAGSRVVLQYVYHDAPPRFLPNHFVSSWLFQGVHRQLGEARWVVQVPAGRELAMHVQGPVEHAVERGQGEHDVHTFTASDVPPLVPEPAMPPPRNLLAMVVLSTLSDWGEYVEWERALLSEVFQVDPELRALAGRLTADAETPQERLDAIYRYVAQEIRYQQDYEDTIAGVRPHSCPVVLERGYGDCKDKAVLMILLGREVGLDLRFAVLRTTRAGRVFADVPNQQFNHAIVYVPAQDGIAEGHFVDPTTDGLDIGNLRADDQGATALVLDPDDGEWEILEIPYQDPSLTYYRCEIDVDVEGPEAAEARAACRLRGRIAGAYRRVMRNDERAAQLRQNVAHMIFSGSTVTEASAANVEAIDAPLELSLTLDASAALQPRGEARRIPVPLPFTLGRLTRLESRRTPLRLGPPDSARWTLTYRAPPGGRIVRAPEDVEVEHPCFTLSRRTETRGRTATVVLDYERRCAEVPPEDYPELRRQAQRAANLLEDYVVVQP